MLVAGHANANSSFCTVGHAARPQRTSSCWHNSPALRSGMCFGGTRPDAICWFSAKEPLCVCVFRAHQSCFNARSQTLNKEYDNTTKYNQTIQSVLFCSAFQAPRWPPSARSTSVNVSHRLSIEMSLIWMYLLYFNMGLLNERVKLKQRKLLTAVFSTSEVIHVFRCFCVYVAENVHRRDDKKLHLISSKGTAFISCAGL